MPGFPQLLAGAGVAGAACLAWGVAESAMFTVRRATAPVLPAGSREITVLHVSDVHLLPRQGFKLDFLRQLAALRPDVIVNTGDNIASADAIRPLMSAWGQLRFTPGVFVFGSNDYVSPGFRNPLSYLRHGRSDVADEVPDLPTEQLRQAMTAVGWQDLTHRRATLEVGGLRLDFRGTDDGHLDRDDYARVAGSPDPGADVTIGVTHAPYLRLLDAMTADGVDLIMAGHTHGGQVCVPGYGALVTNCDLDRARVKGLSRHTHAGRTTYLHVSAGIGTSPFAPYRFACRPEVTLLTLLPATTGG